MAKLKFIVISSTVPHTFNPLPISPLMKSVTSKNETLAYWFLDDIALTSEFEKRILYFRTEQILTSQECASLMLCSV